MPTEFWYPINAANHDLPAGTDSWTLTGAASKNEATRPGGGRLGPMTHDGATTIIGVGCDGTTKSQALNIDWPGPMAQYTGTTFTAYGRDNVTGGTLHRWLSFANAGGTSGGLYYDATDSNLEGDRGPFDVRVAATYRPGGGSWSSVDFADDKTTFVVAGEDSAGGNGGWFTSLWGQIDYIPPAGGFAFLLGIAGLLPVLGSLTDFAHFARYLAWRRACHPRHTLLAGDEVERAWREIRAYRHPTFFLPRFA